MNNRRTRGSVALLVAVLAAAGCGVSSGPNTAPATGFDTGNTAFDSGTGDTAASADTAAVSDATGNAADDASKSDASGGNTTAGDTTAGDAITVTPDTTASTDSGQTADAGIAEYTRSCDPCQTGTDCKQAGHETACVDRGKEGRFCGLRCDSGATCPAGQACQNATTSEGIEATYCVPVNSVGEITECRCSASATQAKLSTPCWVEQVDANGKPVGKCPGKRTCTSPVLGICQMNSPDNEVCDGIDNDCDGFVDPTNMQLCPSAQDKCVAGKCTKDCKPVDGGWTAWQAGVCDKTCGTGALKSTRTCTAPAPSCGGKQCSGSAEKSEPCNTQACPTTTGELLPGKTIHATGETVITGKVPAGKTSLELFMWGGGGGGGAPGSGGGGAFVHATVTVKGGDVVELRVAGGGVSGGGGGGASYALVNGAVQIVAAGGGGAGSDGCSGCSGGTLGAGGGGGMAGVSGGNGQANDKYKTGSDPGQGGTQTAGGALGTSHNASQYTTCTLDGLPGKANEGGAGAFGKCNHKTAGPKWHEGGKTKGGNGTGGDGGSGWFGGGSGATMWTYSGGGGGGGSSYVGPAAKLVTSEAGGIGTSGGATSAEYKNSAAIGGGGQIKAFGDAAKDGRPGLVVLIL